MPSRHQQELDAGERFEFGANWSRFLAVLSDQRIQTAQDSLVDLLGFNQLTGRRFLDIGSGSGLFSLAARRLGARVHSFDYDPLSVACTEELKRRFFPRDPDWTIESGSVLEGDYIRSLGPFDVVYSWGVLHHTGQMWQALENACLPVVPGGMLAVALYNDQQWRSRMWRRVKETYCSGWLGRACVLATFVPLLASIAVALGVRRSGNPCAYFRDYQTRRGMSVVHDWVDWLGGLPFEVATPDAVVQFCRQRQFETVKLQATRSSGNNQFVFARR